MSEKIMNELQKIIVVGAGAAGLSCALNCADFAEVILLADKDLEDSSTWYAQGGIASALSRSDNNHKHVDDTVKTGKGLCNIKVVDQIIRKSQVAVEWLSSLGVNFNKNKDQDLFLKLEAGHGQARIVHVEDRIGLYVSQALIDKVKAHPNINVLTKHKVIDLLVESDVCFGAQVLKPNGDLKLLLSDKVVLATGGASNLYSKTTSFHKASGSGILMAYRAGCRVADLEFVQFHPTCLFAPHLSKPLLMSETLRGFGAKLCLEDGSEFLNKYSSKSELASRDILAKAIHAEMQLKKLSCVYLDLTAFSRSVLMHQFPFIYKSCLEAGYDLAKVKVPVAPAAHYTCGGVVTNHFGKTDIVDLYAIGEVSCTALHGANRLASNSLLECVVMALELSRHLSKLGANKKVASDFLNSKQIVTTREIDCGVDIDFVQQLMWSHVGLQRDNQSLEEAAGVLAKIKRQLDQEFIDSELFINLIDLRNLVELALLTINSAIFRKESRGGHYNVDYPCQQAELDGLHVVQKKDWLRPDYVRDFKLSSVPFAS